MADHTIAAGESGVYELELAADTPVSVAVLFLGVARRAVEVMHHEGDRPVYVGRTTLMPRDADALTMVPPSSTDEVTLYAEPAVLWLVSAADCTVSVAKA